MVVKPRLTIEWLKQCCTRNALHSSRDHAPEISTPVKAPVAGPIFGGHVRDRPMSFCIFR
jgi:hypothetical protein